MILYFIVNKPGRMFYNQYMRKILVSFSLLLLFFVFIMTAASQSCSELPVTVEHHSIPAEALHGELNFDVYIPPCMDERIIGGYPVVYLLHGQDMGIDIWQEMNMDTIIRDTINLWNVPLFLTVVPQEDQYLLSFSLSGYEEAILDTLIPWIDDHYNTCTARNCRSLGGLSRGALWAEKIALEHPDIFGSVGLLSIPGKFTDDQSLYYLAERHMDDTPLRIRMDTGTEDSYRHEGSNAAAQLTYIGYPYEYYIQPGKHNTDYWQSMLDEYFIWFSHDWKENQSSLTITQTAE